MTKSANSEIQIQQILVDHAPPVRDLAERLRGLILSAAPTAVESAYPGWHGIGYVHPRAGYFCAIFPLQEMVKVGFESGALLPGPAGLLHGDGKQLRTVELSPHDAIPAGERIALVQAALDLPPRRADKVAMLRAGAG